MEKVICDLCGTAYPETADQCPICGCARSDSGITSAGNTEEDTAYTYTKGGRFSKSNVRKRLKAAQVQPVPMELPDRNPEPEEPTYDDDYDDYDEDEDDVDEDPTSNRGLIVIVVLLLLAIIAVASYIATVQFDLFGSKNTTRPTGTTAATNSGSVFVPCAGLTVDSSVVLDKVGDSVRLNVTVKPATTTDTVVYSSSDESVATVDSTGLITAVGEGEATITVSCGDFEQKCKVSCTVSEPTAPTVPVEPTEPTQPTEPSVPKPDVELKLNRTDFTLNKKDSSWNVYSGELDPAEIKWTSLNEKVVTVTNGKVVAVGVGRTQIVAEYGDQTVTCWVSCSWRETDPEPTNPEADKYSFYIGANKVSLNADITISIGETVVFKIEENEMSAPVQVEWTASEEGIVTINGNKITGASAKNTGVKLTATHDGYTFTCIVRVKDVTT